MRCTQIVKVAGRCALVKNLKVAKYSQYYCIIIRFEFSGVALAAAVCLMKRASLVKIVRRYTALNVTFFCMSPCKFVLAVVPVDLRDLL